MTSVDTVPSWSAEIVRTEVRGTPCPVFTDRPRRVSDVVVASRRWHDREFLVQGGRRLTFGDHESAVGRAAAALRVRGIRPGDRVGIFAANSPEWVTWFYAITWVGAVAVPCNGWWSRDELAYACARVEPRLVLIDPRRAPLVPDGVAVLDVSVLHQAAADVRDAAGQSEPADVDEDAPALILFTSGTTGRPKGAILSHRALCANLQNLLVVSRRLPRELGPDHPASVTLICLPLFHIGAIQLALVPLVTGSKLIFLDGRFDPAAVADLIDDERVTMMSAARDRQELRPDRGLRSGELGRRGLARGPSGLGGKGHALCRGGLRRPRRHGAGGAARPRPDGHARVLGRTTGADNHRGRVVAHG